MASSAARVFSASTLRSHLLMLLSDHPRRSGDTYGWGEIFIPHLARVVREWTPREGMTLGLYGPWGSGKSTALNLLATHLEVHRERYPYTVVARFNPWFYDDLRSLTTSFFGTIGESLANTDASGAKEAGRALKTMGKFLGAAASAITVMGVGVDNEKLTAAAKVLSDAGEGFSTFADTGERPLIEARSKAERSLQALGASGGRLLVLIDDVDRLDRKELLALLRLVRTVADLPSVTLVLAMDEGRVFSMLDEATKDGYGKGYLEKIVQVGVHVPVVPPIMLADQFRRGVEEILGHQKVYSSSEFLRPLQTLDLWEYRQAMDFIATPRDLARYLNALRVLALARAEWDLHPGDALFLTALQVFHPDVYDRVRRSRGFLTGDGFDVANLILQGEDLKARKKRRLTELVTGFTDGDLPSSDAPLMKLIRGLFGDILQGFHPTPGDAAMRRIRSPRAFDSYFSFAPSDLPSYVAVSQFLDDVAHAATDGDIPRVIALIRSNFPGRETETWNARLVDLRFRFASLRSPALEAVASAIWQVRSELPEPLQVELPLAMAEALEIVAVQRRPDETYPAPSLPIIVGWLTTFESPARALEWIEQLPTNQRLFYGAWRWIAYEALVDHSEPGNKLSLTDGARVLYTFRYRAVVQGEALQDVDMEKVFAFRARLVNGLKAEPSAVPMILQVALGGSSWEQWMADGADPLDGLARFLGGEELVDEVLPLAAHAAVADPEGILEKFVAQWRAVRVEDPSEGASE